MLTEAQLLRVGLKPEDSEESIGYVQAIFNYFESNHPFTKKLEEVKTLDPSVIKEMPDHIRLGYNLQIENYFDEINNRQTFEQESYALLTPYKID